MSKVQARQTSVVNSVTVPGGKSFRSSSSCFVAAIRGGFTTEARRDEEEYKRHESLCALCVFVVKSLKRLLLMQARCRYGPVRDRVQPRHRRCRSTILRSQTASDRADASALHFLKPSASMRASAEFLFRDLRSDVLCARVSDSVASRTGRRE